MRTQNIGDCELRLLWKPVWLSSFAKKCQVSGSLGDLFIYMNGLNEPVEIDIYMDASPCNHHGKDHLKCIQCCK